jgi:hypothetical protein
MGARETDYIQKVAINIKKLQNLHSYFYIFKYVVGAPVLHLLEYDAGKAHMSSLWSEDDDDDKNIFFNKQFSQIIFCEALRAALARKKKKSAILIMMITI